MITRSENILVSIILPLYNVEKYMSRCINSLLKQSYSNFEIILINDGSPDSSGMIADQFSKNDKRIKVTHTENKGVSCARNLGIEISRGDYIVFVDSDDFLSDDYLEYMLSIVNITGSDFVMSRNCFYFPGDTKQIEFDNIQIYSSEKAATELIYPGLIDIGCWNKMFNRKFLIDNKIKFPESFYMGEGLNFILNAANVSNSIGVGLRKVYYYRKNNVSSATSKLNIPKFENAIKALQNIKEYHNPNSTLFDKSFDLHMLMTEYAALSEILKGNLISEYELEYEMYLMSLRKGLHKIFFYKTNLINKIRIVMTIIQPKLTYKFVGLLKKILKKDE